MKETTEEITPDSTRDNCSKTSYKRLSPPPQISSRSQRKIYKHYKPFRQVQKKSDQSSHSRSSYLQKISFRSVARAKHTNRIRCKFCVRHFKSVRVYYQHVSEVHFKTNLEETDAETMSQSECEHSESKDLATEPANTVVDPPPATKSTTLGQVKNINISREVCFNCLKNYLSWQIQTLLKYRHQNLMNT